MANFVVLHMEKGQGADTRMSMHIERDFIAGNVDANRVKNDKELINFPEGVANRSEAIEHRINTAGLTRKVGKNQVHVIRVLLSASPEAMQRIQEEGKLDDWCQASVSWLQDTFGKENIVSAVLHMDESTPHIHASLVPITSAERRKKKKEEEVKRHYRKKTAGTRLSADDIMARDKLKQYQTSYARAMAAFGLERGIDGSDARHVGTKEYYTQLNRQNVSLQKDVADLQSQKSSLEADIQKEKSDFEKQRQELETQIRKLSINKQGKEALLERLNGITFLFGKSKVQQSLELSQQENDKLRQQIEALKAKVDAIQAKLDRRVEERDLAQADCRQAQQHASDLEAQLRNKNDELAETSSELVAVKQERNALREKVLPERYALPDVIDMSRSHVTTTPRGLSIAAYFTDKGRVYYSTLSDSERRVYYSGDVTLAELIGRHYTHQIDVALCNRWRNMPDPRLSRELMKVSKTMFRTLPLLIFPASYLTAFNYPGGSRDTENPNIRHKSKEEILRELIDEGYQMSY